ncbi:MAG: hypothetical protein ACXWC1_34110, partial [Burkholderiales bacterium]
ISGKVIQLAFIFREPAKFTDSCRASSLVSKLAAERRQPVLRNRNRRANDTNLNPDIGGCTTCRLGSNILLHDTKEAAQKIRKRRMPHGSTTMLKSNRRLRRFSTLVQAGVASIHIGPRWQQGKSMKWAIWTLEWLRSLGLEAAFRDNEIDDTIAPSLTAGVVLGRALLLSQIR